MKYLVIVLFIFPIALWSQYQPEIDVSGSDNAADGGELQLATPSLTNFLRLFSGRTGDPNPFLNFNKADEFHISSGKFDFSQYAFLMSIKGTGEVTITNLSGAGTQSVEVDANGQLQRSGFKYFSVPPSAFRGVLGNNNSLYVDQQTVYLTNNSSDPIYAPIMLPDNCIVTNVQVDFIDNDPANDVELILWKQSGGTSSQETILTTSSSSTAIRSLSSSATFNVDNQNASYSFGMHPLAANTMSPNFQIVRVLIQYID